MKKLFSIFLFMAVIFTSSFAMAGYESYLPDNSGEYVYYRDYTFLRESYFGILYYDDATLQLRYYAPRDVKQKLPETEVSILVSVDPEADHMVLTGERILSTIVPGSENVDIVNYLHDILYEFSAHRKLIIDLNERDIELYQDYSQFGGRVEITYDCTIPIFNIREIESADGKTLLECCTIGQLVDSNDKSFDNFKGFPSENYKKGRSHYKKAKTVKCFFNDQTVELDSNWEQPMENFWTLNNDAMVSMSTIPPYDKDSNKTVLYIIRKLIASTSNSYANFDTLDIDDDDGCISISVEYYQPITGKTVLNNKVITPASDSSSYDFFSLAVYKQPWIDNLKYYENILDSYEN